jgi:Ca2+:H+ antiporter
MSGGPSERPPRPGRGPEGGRNGDRRHPRRPLFGSLFSGEGWPYILVPLIPIALYLDFVARADPTILFITSAFAVIPTAALMGRATEELAERSGPGIGGLMNVTFGNLPELIIAFVALNAGLYEVVKAWVIGSILGNVLLVLGASMFIGGLRNRRQTFAPKAASAQATMLILAGSALIIPAILFVTAGGSLPVPGEADPSFTADIEKVSLLVAVILLGTYGGGLLFSLMTHRDLFNPEAETGERDAFGYEPWSVKKAVILLAIAGVAVALMAEILVDSISETARSAGVSEFFIAVIVVAVVGNAAEHWVAILVAYKNKMDLAVNIAIGSSAQVALFVGPLLVVLSFFFGPAPMPLVFNALEIASVLLAVFIASYVARTGESMWFEGVTLIAVYVTLAVTFFFA